MTSFKSSKGKNRKTKNIANNIFVYGYIFFIVMIIILTYSDYNNYWLVSKNKQAKINICFVPSNQNCMDLIIKEIDRALYSIKMQTYAFTSKPIAESLIRAKNRNVEIQILCDKSQFSAKYSQIPVLIKYNIPIRIDDVKGIAHNKVIIIDYDCVITGSFNFTFAAQNRNAENVLLINDPITAKIYIENFDNRWKVYDSLGSPFLPQRQIIKFYNK